MGVPGQNIIHIRHSRPSRDDVSHYRASGPRPGERVATARMATEGTNPEDSPAGRLHDHENFFPGEKNSSYRYTKSSWRKKFTRNFGQIPDALPHCGQLTRRPAGQPTSTTRRAIHRVTHLDSPPGGLDGDDSRKRQRLLSRANPPCRLYLWTTKAVNTSLADSAHRPG